MLEKDKLSQSLPFIGTRTYTCAHSERHVHAHANKDIYEKVKCSCKNSSRINGGRGEDGGAKEKGQGGGEDK